MAASIWRADECFSRRAGDGIRHHALNIVRQFLPELHSDWGEHWEWSATSLERRVGAGDRKTVGNHSTPAPAKVAP
jgi:hypothetical protein